MGGLHDRAWGALGGCASEGLGEANAQLASPLGEANARGGGDLPLVAAGGGGGRRRRMNMEYIPGIFTFKNEAYVVNIQRGMDYNALVEEVSNRWSLLSEQFELKCMIPENSQSMMKMLNGSDLDRMFDMHSLLGCKVINVQVQNKVLEEIVTYRPSGEQSSVSDNVVYSCSGNSSGEMRLRSDLWRDLIHSSNQIFSNVEHLREDLNKYAIARGFDYDFSRNEQTRLTVGCRVKTCNWSLHAIRIGSGPIFKIKSLNNVHTCGGGLSTQRHPRASKKWVSSIVMEKLKDTPLYRPKVQGKKL